MLTYKYIIMHKGPKRATVADVHTGTYTKAMHTCRPNLTFHPLYTHSPAHKHA